MKKNRAVIGFLFFLFIFNFYICAELNQRPDNTYFEKRRQALMDKMEGGIAILSSPKRSVRNSDIFYPYRQDSNFYYLTGLEKPETVVMLIPDAKKKFIVFIKSRNPMFEIWAGEKMGVEEAVQIIGADEAFPIKKLEKMLPRYLMGKENIYCNFNDKEFMKKLAAKTARSWDEIQKKLININHLVHELRLIKGPEEIGRLQRAIDITGDALIETMKAVKPGMVEYEIEALIGYIYRKNGSPRPGFWSIVASGPNAAIMHYQKNNRRMKNSDLLLMDIGAEYGYYSADITRTIPVNGRFNEKQKEIYRIVLNAQKKGIQNISPGKGIKEVMKISTDVLKDGLFRLGLILDKQSRWQTHIWIKYFQTSHWLGLDTHDVGVYKWKEKNGRILEPGMVLTVEPGIYIGENDLENIPKLLKGRVEEKEINEFITKVRPAFEKYKNISVRIEDDILITKDGYINLSKKAPKEIKDIEKLMKKRSWVK